MLPGTKVTVAGKASLALTDVAVPLPAFDRVMQ
jgi:hypothetical protein